MQRVCLHIHPPVWMPLDPGALSAQALDSDVGSAPGVLLRAICLDHCTTTNDAVVGSRLHRGLAVAESCVRLCCRERCGAAMPRVENGSERVLTTKETCTSSHHSDSFGAEEGQH